MRTNKQTSKISNCSSSYDSGNSSSSFKNSHTKKRARSYNKNKKDEPNHQHHTYSNRNKHYIYVENLTSNVNENHLQEIFSIYGKVIKILKNQTSINFGKQNTSLVEFEKIKDAEFAQKCMDGGQIDGLKIKVKYLDLTDKEIEQYKKYKKIDLILKDRENTKIKEDISKRDYRKVYSRRKSYSPHKNNKYTHRRKRSRSRSNKNSSSKRGKSRSVSSSDSSSSFSGSSSSDYSSSSYSSSSDVSKYNRF